MGKGLICMYCRKMVICKKNYGRVDTPFWGCWGLGLWMRERGIDVGYYCYFFFFLRLKEKEKKGGV
jgi:hypothetical protein